jgi:hypothetical protein
MRPNPFRGLRSYLEEDRARFFGRDRDLILMRERIASGRAVLFFAGSGVGKTSFLRARLIPDAGDRGYECFYWRQWASRECTEGLRQAVASHLGGPEAGSLPELLSARAPEAGPFLLILDQFEEVFQHHTRASCSPCARSSWGSSALSTTGSPTSSATTSG